MSESPEKIVITGSGLVCGAGATVGDVWDRLESGATAVRPFEQWDGENWPVKVASEVRESNRELVPERKLHKTISRTDMYGIYAAERAIDSSGLLEYRESLDEAEVAPFNDRTGLVVGSGGGNYASNYDYFPLMTESGGQLPAFGRELGNEVTPMWLLQNLPNNVLCHVGIRATFKGTNACITNQCAGGIMAVSEAAEAIRNGEADRIVAAGHDAPFEPEMVFYYHKLGLMAGAAPKPFDVGREGTVFGEGAGSVVLERAADAEARGAGVMGEFLGFGCCSEATGILDLEPEGEGVTRAAQEALDRAGLAPSDVGMICAHGNGTAASDRTEAAGIRRVFGDDVPPVTGFKWAYGHLIAAAGIVDVVVALEALKRGVVPGIATLDSIDPAIRPFPVDREATEPRSDVALVICRGFGGMNVALVLRGA